MLLSEIQEKFTHFCRTGKKDRSLKANPKRLDVYLELYRNIIDSALEKMYPLTCKALKKKQWQTLIDAFVADEDCTSPLFWQMPKFLMEFVKKGKWAKEFKVPYLNDLMHFEWLEVEIEMMPDAPKQPLLQEGHVLQDLLFFNPESTLVHYAYPVFEKKELPRPMQKGHYFVLGFRLPENGQAFFISLSPFFAKVVESLQEKPLTGEAVLKSTAKLFKLDETKVLAKGEKFLEDLLEQQAISGFKKKV